MPYTPPTVFEPGQPEFAENLNEVVSSLGSYTDTKTSALHSTITSEVAAEISESASDLNAAIAAGDTTTLASAHTYTDAEIAEAIAGLSGSGSPQPWLTVVKATGRSNTNIAVNEMIPFVISDDVGTSTFIEKNIVTATVAASPTERFVYNYTPEGRTGSSRLKVSLYTTDSFAAQTVTVRLKTVTVANFSAGSGNYRLYVNSFGSDIMTASFAHAGGKRADVFMSSTSALSALNGFFVVTMDAVNGLTSASKLGINVEVQTKILG